MKVNRYIPVFDRRASKRITLKEDWNLKSVYEKAIASYEAGTPVEDVIKMVLDTIVDTYLGDKAETYSPFGKQMN